MNDEVVRQRPDAQRSGLRGSITFLSIARISTVAAFFAVNIVATRLLDPDAVGSAAVGQTIGMIAALVANGGLNISTIYFLQQRPAERRSLAPGMAGLAAVAVALSVALVVLSTPLMSWLAVSAAWPLLGAAAVMGGGMIAFEFGGALLLGLDHRGGYVLLELLRGWGSLAAVVILLLVWPTDAALVLGLALGYVAGALLGLMRARAEVPLRPRLDPEFSGEAVRFGLRGQVGNIFQFLGVRLDLLLVPAFLDLTSAGIYFVAVRVSDVIGQVATAASSLVFPQVAAQEDRRSTATTESVTRIILILVIASAIGIGVIAEPLLGIAFGPAYTAGTNALVLSLAAVVPLSLGRVLAADLKGRGRPGLVSLSALLSVTATVIFDVLFIPRWGIVGAALASLVTYTITTTALLVAYRSVTDGHLSSLVPRLADLRTLVGLVRRRSFGVNRGAS